VEGHENCCNRIDILNPKWFSAYKKIQSFHSTHNGCVI
jgi:hypothetical protein